MDALVRNGLLVTCDAPILRLILFLNWNSQFGKIVRLDDTHLLMEEDYVDQIRLEVDKVLEENVFKFDDIDKL